jgi:hypothetical protein
MAFRHGGRGAAAAVAAIWTVAVTTVEGQAPKPGPVLTDPARGSLQMLMDKEGLGSGDLSIGDRTIPPTTRQPPPVTSVSKPGEQVRERFLTFSSISNTT